MLDWKAERSCHSFQIIKRVFICSENLSVLPFCLHNQFGLSKQEFVAVIGFSLFHLLDSFNSNLFSVENFNNYRYLVSLFEAKISTFYLPF